MSTSNNGMPGMGAMGAMDPMGDTLGFMRSLWAGVKMPGVTVPSLSVEDIDKQIADLKIVENWLGLNMNMLKATIQTLEVQSATLSALKSMGQQVSSSMGDQVEKAVGAAMDAAGAFAKFGPMPGMGGGKQDQPADGAAVPEAQGPAESAFSFAAPTTEKPPAPEPAEEAGAGPASAGEASPSAATIPFVNPAAWWNLLQDQFKQAVDTAVQQTGMDGASIAAGTTGNGAAKPRSRSSTGTPTKSARAPARAGSRKTASGAARAKAGNGKAGGTRATKPASKAASTARKAGARKKS